MCALSVSTPNCYYVNQASYCCARFAVVSTHTLSHMPAVLRLRRRVLVSTLCLVRARVCVCCVRECVCSLGIPRRRRLTRLRLQQAAPRQSRLARVAGIFIVIKPGFFAVRSFVVAAEATDHDDGRRLCEHETRHFKII